MKRRGFLCAGVALLAGCGELGTTSTETSTVTETAASTPTDTPTATATSTPSFAGEVSFPSCSTVRVEADSYSSVFAVLADGSTTEFEGEHSGANTFEAALPIEEVLVYTDDARFSIANPDYDSCVATETPTETESPTATETEADEETATETEADSDGDGVPDGEDYAPNDPDVQDKEDLTSSTESPTDRPTPTPDPRDFVSTTSRLETEDEGTTAIVTGTITNDGERAVNAYASVSIYVQSDGLIDSVDTDTFEVEAGGQQDWEVTYTTEDGQRIHYATGREVHAHAEYP